MPFTFFAHQAPFLPIARRWPHAIDGLALSIGAMTPDLAYVLTGTRFEIWAHNFPGIVWFCVPMTFMVCWLVARVLAVVVPDHLPRLGHFRLHDYRGLAVWQPRLVRTSACGLAGAISHALIDQLTHGYGWFAQTFPWYTRPIGTWEFVGRPWEPFRIAQYIGHVGFTALALALLWRYGKQRWLDAAASQVPQTATSFRSHFVLWVSTMIVAVPLLLLGTRGEMAFSTLTIRVAGALFAGLCVGAIMTHRRIDT